MDDLQSYFKVLDNSSSDSVEWLRVRDFLVHIYKETAKHSSSFNMISHNSCCSKIKENVKLTWFADVKDIKDNNKILESLVTISCRSSKILIYAKSKLDQSKEVARILFFWSDNIKKITQLKFI